MLTCEMGDLTSVPIPRTVNEIYNKYSVDKIIKVEAQVLPKETTYQSLSSECLRSTQRKRASEDISNDQGHPLGKTGKVLAQCLTCSPHRF